MFTLVAEADKMLGNHDQQKLPTSRQWKNQNLNDKVLLLIVVVLRTKEREDKYSRAQASSSVFIPFLWDTFMLSERVRFFCIENCS